MSRPQRLVIGMGESGMSIAAYWYNDYDLTIVDDRQQPPHLDAIKRRMPTAAIHAWENFRGWKAADYERYERIGVSPGVDIDSIAAPRDKLTNDMACFSDAWQSQAKARILLAVTGTNGKSTVTALAAHLIGSSGLTTAAVGNIGEPVLNAWRRWTRYGFPQAVVAELSSFHLELAGDFYSDAAVVLNVGDDHLDRHRSRERYAAIKRRIYNRTQCIVENRAAGLYPDLSAAVSYSISGDEADWTQRDGWICRRGTPCFAITAMSPSCQNYIELVLAALALTDPLQLPHDGVLNGLASFDGLPHRRQLVARVGEVSYVDDSKATNVEAALFALRRSSAHVVWIGGGDGKGQDFSPLLQAAGRMRAAVLLGRDADAIAALLHSAKVPCIRVEDMTTAVARAREQAQPGDTVLLSPACSSLDMFADYHVRGAMFARAVRELAADCGEAAS